MLFGVTFKYHLEFLTVEGLIPIKWVLKRVPLRRVTLVVALLVLLPVAVCIRTAAVLAATEYYTVQVGSYDADGAEKNYALLERYLTGEDLDHLRIEKVQGFHTVRIGRFERRGPARLLREKVSGRYSSALVLSAYIKDERIIRLFTDDVAPMASSGPAFGEAGTPVAVLPPSVQGAGESAREFYTIQVGSYPDSIGAARSYTKLEQSLDPDDLDHLRVELVRGYHTVRIGGFAAKGSARELLFRVRRLYSDAVLLSAYIKQERITRIFSSAVAEPPVVPAEETAERLTEAEKTEKTVEAVEGTEVTPVEASGGIRRLFANPLFAVDRDDSGDPLGVPMDVFYDPFMKEVYVSASFRGNRVLVYGADYFPLLSLGGGRGIGSATGLYVDRQGRLFLCQQPDSDHPYGRLSILNPAMLPEREIVFDGSHGLGGNGSFFPVRIALDRNEEIIYLVGNKGDGLHVFDITGKYLRHLNVPRAKVLPVGSDRTAGLTGKAPDFVAINDVVVTGNPGRIYLLSDEVDRVIVYDSITEEFLFAFGLGGGSRGKLSRPKGIAVDEKRQLVYVVDYMRHAVLIYSLEGEFLHEFGGIGSTLGVFSYPNGIAVDGEGHVIVSEMSNQRLQVFEVIEK